MEINGRTALVTGANRGLGRHLAEQLRDRLEQGTANMPPSAPCVRLMPAAIWSLNP